MQSAQTNDLAEASGESPSNTGLTTADPHFVEQMKEFETILNCPASKAMLDQVKDQEIAMCVGNTKSGKSTLVNYVIGTELVAVRKLTYPKTLSLVKVNADEEGPIIGLTNVSETTTPTVWSAVKSGLREKIVDAPGFDDNRGEAQDIANAFYIKEIIRTAKSVKFLLISDINDIKADNVNGFTSFMDKMKSIFADTSVLHGGVAIVFCKGDGECTSSDICGKLKEINREHDMVVSGKSLIRFFSDNKGCITFFNMPTLEGPISTSDFGREVLDVIGSGLEGIPRKELVNVKPGISDKSRIFLLQLNTMSCNMSAYCQMLNEVKEGFARVYAPINELETVAEVSGLDATLAGLQIRVDELVQQVGTPLRLCSLLRIIIELGDICGVQNLTEGNNMDLKLQFVEFMDETLGLNTAEVYLKEFNNIVGRIKYGINMARLSAAKRENKIATKEAEEERSKQTLQHEAEMRKNTEEIETSKKENERKAREELERLGVWQHLAEAGKKSILVLGSVLTKENLLMNPFSWLNGGPQPALTAPTPDHPALTP